MKLCIQRVLEANLKISGELIGEIGIGVVAYIGFKEGDSIESLKKMLDKFMGLRIFEDESGKMNLSLSEVGGNILLVPNFTLAARCEKGFRPSFSDGMNPEEAIKFFEEAKKIVVERFSDSKFGVFGADMKISQTNDGPVTIILEK